MNTMLSLRLLRTSVDILKNARDLAFHFNSANVSTFQCAFQAEVSMAMLNSSLRLLYARVSSDDDSSEPMDNVFTMLSFVATRFDASAETDVRPIPFSLEELSEEWKFLSKIKRDGELIKEEWQDPSFHLDFVASKVLQRGQRIIEVLSQCPLEAFAEDVLKPVLSELRQYSNSQRENGSSMDCMPILYIHGVYHSRLCSIGLFSNRQAGRPKPRCFVNTYCNRLLYLPDCNLLDQYCFDRAAGGIMPRSSQCLECRNGSHVTTVRKGTTSFGSCSECGSRQETECTLWRLLGILGTTMVPDDSAAKFSSSLTGIQ